MGEKETYPVEYNGHIYNLNRKKVNRLINIGEYKGLNVEISFILKDKTVIKGKIIDFEEYKSLDPADINIPITFKILVDDKQQITISFLDIETTEIHKK